MATEVKIKIRAFPYYVEGEDPVTGKKVRRERIARRGDTVELSDVDLERAKRFGAIEGEGDSPRSSEGGELDVSTASVEDLASWIEEDEPTVAEVIAAAEGDSENAEKLLEAENLATGQDPRKGVEDGLNKIIGS